MKVNARTLLIAVAITAGVTWYMTAKQDRGPLPHERPVLQFVAKWAKSLLWLAMFADPPPDTPPEPIQQTVGDDGYPQLAHARSL
jgi:hypothetical protein